MDPKTGATARKTTHPTQAEWQNYWLLYLDLAGVSRRVSDRSQRQHLANVYSKFVNIAVLWALPMDQKLQTLGLSLDDIERVRADGADALAGGKNASMAKKVDQSIRTWKKRVHIFSDSVFVFFDCHVDARTRTAHIRNLAQTAAHMSAVLWEAGMPHKGAISYGECYLDGHVCLGEPIVRAVEWEKEQEWLGISVSPESVGAAEDAPFLKHELVRHEVGRTEPKAGVPTYCVDVPGFVAGLQQDNYRRDETPSLAAVVDGLKRAATSADSEKLRRRYRATASFWGQSRACKNADAAVRTALDEIIGSCGGGASR